MSQSLVEILSPVNALQLGRDAKIIAIRWDLVPWCLVFDCDVPVEEDIANAPTRRAWLVFQGMHEISWPLLIARLPNGVFATDAIVTSESDDGFYKFELPVMTPTFAHDDKLTNNCRSKITISAQGLVGLISIANARFGELGPSRQERNALATDDDFLQAIAHIDDS